MAEEWIRIFEKSGMPLSKCRVRTQKLVACAMIKLGVRLTKDGWELIEEGK